MKTCSVAPPSIFTWRSIALVAAMIVVAVVARLLPHPPNFTPMAALAIFGGALLGRTWVAAGVVVAAMLVSDAIIGFHSWMAVVYACLVANVLIGSRLRNASQNLRSGRSWAMIGGGTLAGSLLFFVVTNFVVWTTHYPATLSGLSACYVAAIPFFQNTLLGDVFYGGLMFGSLAATRSMASRRVVAQAA